MANYTALVTEHIDVEIHILPQHETANVLGMPAYPVVRK